MSRRGQNSWPTTSFPRLARRMRVCNTRTFNSKVASLKLSSGRAEERTHAAGGTFYALWAADVVKNEIHKGGWRLAALLEQAVQ